MILPYHMGIMKTIYMFKTRVKELAKSKDISTPKELHMATGLSLNACKKFWDNSPAIQMIHGESIATLMTFFEVEYWTDLFDNKLYVSEQKSFEYKPSQQLAETGPDYQTDKE